MATKRYISTSLWTDDYIEDLELEEKLVFIYLLTNPLCNVAGIYQITLKRVSYETGVCKENITACFEKFQTDKKLSRFNNWLILNNFPKHQSVNPSVKIGMQRVIDLVPVEVFQNADCDSLSHFTLLNLTLPNLTLLNSSEREKVSEKNTHEEISEKSLDQEILESTTQRFGEFVRLSNENKNDLLRRCGSQELFNQIIEELNDAIGSADQANVKKLYNNHFYAFSRFLRTKLRNKKVPAAKNSVPVVKSETRKTFEKWIGEFDWCNDPETLASKVFAEFKVGVIGRCLRDGACTSYPEFKKLAAYHSSK